jgi:hypothetical protein
VPAKFYDLRVMRSGEEVANLTTDLDLNLVDLTSARLRKVLTEAIARDGREREAWRYTVQVRDRGRSQVLLEFVNSQVAA